jgi:hypothetical protein
LVDDCQGLWARAKFFKDPTDPGDRLSRDLIRTAHDEAKDWRLMPDFDVLENCPIGGKKPNLFT